MATGRPDPASPSPGTAPEVSGAAAHRSPVSLCNPLTTRRRRSSRGGGGGRRTGISAAVALRPQSRVLSTPSSPRIDPVSHGASRSPLGRWWDADGCFPCLTYVNSAQSHRTPDLRKPAASLDGEVRLSALFGCMMVELTTVMVTISVGSSPFINGTAGFPYLHPVGMN